MAGKSVRRDWSKARHHGKVIREIRGIRSEKPCGFPAHAGHPVGAHQLVRLRWERSSIWNISSVIDVHVPYGVCALKTARSAAILAC